MSTPSTASRRAAPAAPAPSTQVVGGEWRSEFLRTRLSSALALLPLGAWTVVHLWNNLAALQSGDAWQKAVTEYPHPVAEAAAAVVVLLPLAIHTVWGIGRLASSRPNNLAYRFYPNLK